MVDRYRGRRSACGALFLLRNLHISCATTAGARASSPLKSGGWRSPSRRLRSLVTAR